MNFEDFIKDKNSPLVFKNCIIDWSTRLWSLECLSKILKDKNIKCKIGPKFQGVFETDCLYLDITMSDFIEWCNGRSNTTSPLYNINRDEYFCYLDYQYMSELFDNNEDVLKSVDWGEFGLYDRNGNDSTIWIGSEGCTTPCHYDTYGFNLVAQIYGSKKWYLFHPSDTEYLYPTRIPYEESSVFSEVNITQPDFKKHPKFKNCHVYIVTLEPGDVLYVPRHWWHYVECTQTAISINTWVEMEEDKESRIKEAITRILVSSLMSTIPQDTYNYFINPNENLQPGEMNIEYLSRALQSRDGRETQNISNSDSLLRPTSTSVCEIQTDSSILKNKFLQFCDKFSSQIVYEGADYELRRKRHIEDQSNSSVKKFSKMSSAENVDILLGSDRDTNSVKLNETIREKSAKSGSDFKWVNNNTPEIIVVQKYNIDDIIGKRAESKMRDISETDSFYSNKNHLVERLIKNVLKPNVIDCILKEFNKSC